ncbi:MAG: ATP-binding protein [Acidimicrobiia bacterium]
MSSRGSRRTPLVVQFLLYFAVAYIALIGAMGWFVDRSVESAFTERLLDHLETAARISAAGMPGGEDSLGPWIDEAAAASGYRYTVIDPTGTVVADSHSDPSLMENHADRPEVMSALGGEIGRDTRLSETTGFEQLYVAVPTDDLVLRVSVAARDLARDTWPFRSSIILISVATGVVGLAVVAWLARRLSAPVAELTRQTLALAEGTGGGPVDRSNLEEIDQLGAAIRSLDAESRARLLDSERASATLEVVLGALPQGTILFGDDDLVAYANPSAHDLLGAVPQTLSALVPFAFQGVVEECRRLRKPTSVIAEHGKPARSLRAIATPFAENHRVLLVIVDVTERERSASVRRDFVANASHELKTPVSAIVASSEALRLAVERGDASAIRFARQIEDSAHQLDRLVVDLLDLSRLERDRPEMIPLSLDHLVREELKRARASAEGKGLSVMADLEPVQVAGSRRDLGIAVRNLLDNAVRYTGNGGIIGAKLIAENGEAVLVVFDTGDGIPTRDLGRVFERFYRVDSARARATGGTGLGLAIVKHIVDSHGGSVGVESELGAGATFTVRLPVLQVEAAASN